MQQGPAKIRQDRTGRRLSAATEGGGKVGLESTPEADRDRLTKFEDETRTRGVAADVLFVVAGVSAATSVLLFLLMPDDAPQSTAGFAPVPGGGVLTVRAPLPEWGW